MTTCGPGFGRALRAAVVTALLLPYLVLQSISTGVMPVAGPDGLRLEICTGAAVTPAGSGGPVPVEDSDGHGPAGACPWAVAQMAALLEDFSVGPAVVGGLRRQVQIRPAPAPLSGGDWSRPYARGPPGIA